MTSQCVSWKLSRSLSFFFFRNRPLLKIEGAGACKINQFCFATLKNTQTGIEVWFPKENIRPIKWKAAVDLTVKTARCEYCCPSKQHLVFYGLWLVNGQLCTWKACTKKWENYLPKITAWNPQKGKYPDSTESAFNSATSMVENRAPNDRNVAVLQIAGYSTSRTLWSKCLQLTKKCCL